MTFLSSLAIDAALTTSRRYFSIALTPFKWSFRLRRSAGTGGRVISVNLGPIYLTYHHYL